MRKLFKLGLVKPTENAIAQAAWVARSSYGLEFEPARSTAERQFEAMAWGELVGSRWRKSIEGAELWFRDEPFSSRPAKFGSWVAQVTMEDYETAARFARAGLRMEPHDALLLNNLTVCLANQRRLQEAHGVFGKIRQDEAVVKSEATYWATKGLLEYRGGDVDAGRSLYGRAVQAALTVRERVWALLYFAREERRVDRETADVIHRVGCKAMEGLSGWERSVAERIAEESA